MVKKQECKLPKRIFTRDIRNDLLRVSDVSYVLRSQPLESKKIETRVHRRGLERSRPGVGGRVATSLENYLDNYRNSFQLVVALVPELVTISW